MITWSSAGVQGRHPFKLKVRTAGGHASMPPIDRSHSGVVTATLLQSLDHHQPPVALRSPVSDMLKALAPYAPPLLKGALAFCDTWCASISACPSPINCVSVRTATVSTHRVA
jgi:hypothetical protein